MPNNLVPVEPVPEEQKGTQAPAVKAPTITERVGDAIQSAKAKTREFVQEHPEATAFITGKQTKRQQDAEIKAEKVKQAQVRPKLGKILPANAPGIFSNVVPGYAPKKAKTASHGDFVAKLPPAPSSYEVQAMAVGGNYNNSDANTATLGVIGGSGIYHNPATSDDTLARIGTARPLRIANPQERG